LNSPVAFIHTISRIKYLKKEIKRNRHESFYNLQALLLWRTSISTPWHTFLSPGK
jgi:hypothetical protein